MAKPETVFIGGVHKHLPATLYRIKNNNMYNSGQADCWYSGFKSDLWVEYKFIVLPKNDSTRVDLGLSTLQQQWLKARHAEGRNVAVVVGCKEGGVWMPGIQWDRPWTTGLFRPLIESRAVLAGKITSMTNI